MNYRKLLRMLDRGCEFDLRDVGWIRRAIGQSLVVFFTRLRAARGDLVSAAHCDKAWHGAEKVPASVVLRCSICGRAYARCEQCERYKPGSAASSMRAHLALCGGRLAQRRRREVAL